MGPSLFSPSDRWQSMRKTLVFTFLTFALFLGAVEVVLNALRLGDDAPFVLDETLMYRPSPSAQFAFVQMPENGGEVIWTEFDERGHRVMDSGDPATADRVIGVYGDSFIQGSFVKSEETFSYFLHQELKRQVKFTIATVNAGVDGYGPDQTYLRLKKSIAEFQHDLVIFSVFADNDLGDLVRNKILYTDPRGQLGFRPVEFAPDVIESYELKSIRSSMMALERVFHAPDLLRKELRVFLERRLGVSVPFLSTTPIESAYRTDSQVDWIGSWLGRGLSEFQEYTDGESSIIQLDNIRSDHYDVDVAIAPDSESAHLKKALLGLLLDKLRALFETHHIIGVLLIIPSPIDVCTGYDWQIDKKKFPNYDPRTLTNLIADVATKHAIPYVNLFEDYQVAHCHELYFHHGNNHWTPLGQKLAATIVADRLIQDAAFHHPHIP